MAPLRWYSTPPTLRAPAVVCSFSGWNDAGDAASSAVGVIARRTAAERVGAFDAEALYDLQAQRPEIVVREGRSEAITWPELEVRAARVSSAPRDLLLVSGPEPAQRWASLTGTIVETARSLDSELLITVGGLLSDVPHTRPVPVTAIATDPSLVEDLGVRETEYEGPTGITGVLHHVAQEAGLPAVSLWAQVPHYVAGVPSPKATLALVRAVERLTGVAVPTPRLAQAANRYEEQVSEAVAADPDTARMLKRLEELADAREAGLDDEDEDDDEAPRQPLDPRRLPSGDALARDFQRFLRDHETDEPEAD